MHVTADSESCSSCTGRRSALTSPSRLACFMAFVPFNEGLNTPWLPERPPARSAAPPNQDFTESRAADIELRSILPRSSKPTPVPSPSVWSWLSIALMIKRTASISEALSSAMPSLRTAQSFAVITSTCTAIPPLTLNLLPNRTALAPAAFTSVVRLRACSKDALFAMSYTTTTNWERPNHSFTRWLARVLPEQSKSFSRRSPTWIWWCVMRFGFCS
mmetsp:Transcript_70091/g.194863  ORF Transcript_70091/g.194863 Transcript_70091/m.194863 type:complete len:217 (-) Transcript_70091:3552-4202(-)